MQDQDTYATISSLLLHRILAKDMTLIDRVFESLDTEDMLNRFCIAPEKIINNAHAIDVTLELEEFCGGDWEIWTTFRKWRFLNDAFPEAEHRDRKESYFAILNEHNGL